MRIGHPSAPAPYPLSSQVRHNLLLAVHEAFTNVLKHSGATRCRIAVGCDASTLEIKVSDNGNVLPRPLANQIRPAQPPSRAMGCANAPAFV